MDDQSAPAWKCEKLNAYWWVVGKDFNKMRKKICADEGVILETDMVLFMLVIFETAAYLGSNHYTVYISLQIYYQSQSQNISSGIRQPRPTTLTFNVRLAS